MTKRPGIKKRLLRFRFIVVVNVHVPLVCFFFDLSICLNLLSMAQPHSYMSMAPDRSRSRDDPPMWDQIDLMTQHIRGPGTILRHYDKHDGY